MNEAICENPRRFQRRSPLRRSRVLRMQLSALLLLSLAPLSAGADLTGIVAFGDSLSDMGNRWIDPKKQDIKFRQTWVAQLAGPKMLNFPGFKPSGMSAFYGGSNYAVGGAGTEVTAAMGPAYNRSQNLTHQVSNRYLNPAFNPTGVDPDALHVIVIGANDIMLASVAPQQIFSQWSGLDQIGIDVARSTEGQIDALADAGVKAVMWGCVFDVARTPAIARRAKMLSSLSTVYLAAVSKAVGAHNAEMDAAIARLTASHEGLRVIKVDFVARFDQVAADPAKFGFEDVTTGANDSHHVFSADGLHPTHQGHTMLADYAFSVLSAELETQEAAPE